MLIICFCYDIIIITGGYIRLHDNEIFVFSKLTNLDTETGCHGKHLFEQWLLWPCHPAHLQSLLASRQALPGPRLTK